jgi:hypothetical protein
VNEPRVKIWCVKVERKLSPEKGKKLRQERESEDPAAIVPRVRHHPTDQRNRVEETANV